MTDYLIYDVFTDRPFGGNPLAIIPDARALAESDLELSAVVAIAIGSTTAVSLGDHPAPFDAILTLEQPSPEAFAAALTEIETPADRP